MVYTLLFSSSKCGLFHNSNLFGSCIIHILFTGCAKIKNIFQFQKVTLRRKLQIIHSTPLRKRLIGFVRNSLISQTKRPIFK